VADFVVALVMALVVVLVMALVMVEVERPVFYTRVSYVEPKKVSIKVKYVQINQKEGNGNIHTVLRSRWYIDNLHPKCFII
jgi:hypothetical protein